jgi:hypothetical protein
MKNILTKSLIISGLLLNSCSSFFCEDGNGEIERKSIEVTNFEEINLQGFGSALINIGETFKVEVETDSNLLSKIKVESDDEDLILSPNSTCPTKLVYHITMPSIEEIEIDGSGEVTVLNKLKSKDLELELHGSGFINLIEAYIEELDAEINGSGNISITGKSEENHFEINGSGNFNFSELKTENAEIKINGSGDVVLDCKEALSVIINGSGTVQYSGNPKVEHKINGSGDVIKI